MIWSIAAVHRQRAYAVKAATVVSFSQAVRLFRYKESNVQHHRRHTDVSGYRRRPDHSDKSRMTITARSTCPQRQDNHAQGGQDRKNACFEAVYDACSAGSGSSGDLASTCFTCGDLPSGPLSCDERLADQWHCTSPPTRNASVEPPRPPSATERQRSALCLSVR